ncbi:MAG: hypothetical protein IJE08_06360 [Clostridia bacterium]|nr:hypothetical protein [Clostridia bacterium]
MKSDKPSPHAGHRARMRARYYQTGLNGFQPHEVIELILYAAIPKKDVNPLAHALIDRFGSVSGVLSASEEELMSVPGVGKHTSTLLRCMYAVCCDYQETRFAGVRTIISAKDAVYHTWKNAHPSFMAEMIVMLEDHAGTLLTCRVFPCRPKDPEVVRGVLTAALTLQAHSAIISIKGYGPLRKLSKNDLKSISTLVSALSSVDVYTLDCLLFSGEHVFSLREAELLVDEKSSYRSSLPNWYYWLAPLNAYPTENGWHHIPRSELLNEK